LLVVWRQNHWDGFLRFGLKTGGDGFLLFGPKTGGDSFSRFGLKTDGFRFSGLGVETKRASVCRLCHKTNGGRTTHDTHRDLTACFVGK
jgi:hypothetical protein